MDRMLNQAIIDVALKDEVGDPSFSKILSAGDVAIVSDVPPVENRSGHSGIHASI